MRLSSSTTWRDWRMEHQVPERRKVLPRKRTLKKGRIVFNERRSTIDCTVRNLSAQGALLLVATLVGIPDSFDLTIDSDMARHRASVVWKRDGQLGVKFV